MRWRAVLFALAFSTASTAAWADAPSLAQGITAFDAGSFDDAVAALSSVTTRAEATLAEIVDAYRYLAAANARRGHDAEAARDADAALALDAAAAPPSPVEPSVSALFERVRARRNGLVAHIAISLAGDLVGERPATVRVTSDGLPDASPMHVVVRCVSDGAVVASTEAAAGDALDAHVRPIAQFAPIDCIATLTTLAGVRVDRRTLHAAAHARDPNVLSDAAAGAHGSRARQWVAACAAGSAVAVTVVVLLGVLLGGTGTTAHLGAPVGVTP